MSEDEHLAYEHKAADVDNTRDGKLAILPEDIPADI